MSEAQARSAKLDDIDSETFARFLEYAYRRDYTIPQWTRDVQDVTAVNGHALKSGTRTTLHFEVDDTTEDDRSSNWGAWKNSNSAPSAFSAMPSLKATKKHVRGQGSSRAAFDNREYLQSSPNASTHLKSLDEPQANTSPLQNFTPVFLAHAQLYTVADMRMVGPLKDLALHKLHKTLVHFYLYPERLMDVVELARYAYEHGEDRSEDGKIDPLRDMVVNYVACEKKALGKHPEFRNLMDGGGEFAGDFWDIVSQELL